MAGGFFVAVLWKRFYVFCLSAAAELPDDQSGCIWQGQGRETVVARVFSCPDLAGQGVFLAGAIETGLYLLHD